MELQGGQSDRQRNNFTSLLRLAKWSRSTLTPVREGDEEDLDKITVESDTGPNINILSQYQPEEDDTDQALDYSKQQGQCRPESAASQSDAQQLERICMPRPTHAPQSPPSNDPTELQVIRLKKVPCESQCLLQKNIICKGGQKGGNQIRCRKSNYQAKEHQAEQPKYERKQLDVKRTSQIYHVWRPKQKQVITRDLEHSWRCKRNNLANKHTCENGRTKFQRTITNELSKSVQKQNDNPYLQSDSYQARPGAQTLPLSKLHRNSKNAYLEQSQPWYRTNSDYTLKFAARYDPAMIAAQGRLNTGSTQSTYYSRPTLAQLQYTTMNNRPQIVIQSHLVKPQHIQPQLIQHQFIQPQLIQPQQFSTYRTRNRQQVNQKIYQPQPFLRHTYSARQTQEPLPARQIESGSRRSNNVNILQKHLANIVSKLI